MKIEKIVPGEFQKYMFGKKGANTTFKGHIRYLSFDSELPPQRPDWTVYGVTLVNLLGKYGNFETDSDSDGLADGWSVSADVTPSLVSGVIGSNAQKMVSDNTGGTATVYNTLLGSQLNVNEGDILFLRAFMKLESENTSSYAPRLEVYWYDASNALIGSDVIYSSKSTSWEPVYGKVTAPTGSVKVMIRAHQPVNVDYVGAYSIDAYAVYNLTKMGALPEPLQELYGVQNWTDLDADTLAQLLPYVDSVASVGYTFNDGTLTVTVENRGKNLLSSSFFTSNGVINNGWVESYRSTATNNDVVLGSSTSFTTFSTEIPYHNTDLTFKAEFEGNGSSFNVYLACYQGTTSPVYIYKEIESNTPVTFTTSEIPTGTRYIKVFLRNFSSTYMRVRNWILVEGDSIDDYEKCHNMSIEFATELHGFEGVYDQLYSQGFKTKHFTRETGITFTYDSENDVSTATVSSNATGTAIVVNEANGEVFFGTTDGTTITVSGKDLSTDTYTIIYQLATPTSESADITGDLIIVPEKNTIIGPDLGFIVIEGTDSIKKAFNTLWR